MDLFNILIYVFVILMFFISNFLFFSISGLILFFGFFVYQLICLHKMRFASSFPVLTGFVFLNIANIFFNYHDVFTYTGSFFYSGFALIFIGSLIFKKPYTFVYFTKGATIDTPHEKIHYLFTLLWSVFFILSLFFSIALKPNISYILMPIVIVICGFVFINYVLPLIISRKKATGGEPVKKTLTIEESLNWMIKMLDPDVVDGWDIVMQYEIDDNIWHVEIKDKKCILKKGKHKNPNLTMFCDTKTWVAITNSEITGEQAYLSGKLKAEGDIEILLQHEKIFDQKRLNDIIKKEEIK